VKLFTYPAADTSSTEKTRPPALLGTSLAKIKLTHKLCEIVGTVTHTCSDKKVCELIAVKVLHASLLNTTVVAFKVLPLGSYAPMPESSLPFKTILEMVLWNDLQCCHGKHTLHLLTRHCR